MELIVYESEGSAIRAGYACSCGCRPGLTYQRDGTIDTHVCCCGDQFALGKDAERYIEPHEGFRLETQAVGSPWGERLTAAWMVGPGGHPPTADGGPVGHAHAHAHDTPQHEHSHTDGNELPMAAGAVIDPVCGMTVDPPVALEKGLHSRYKDTDYFFCGKGCKLDFEDDPEHYLDSAYQPSM